jgi:hypothetical protein
MTRLCLIAVCAACATKPAPVEPAPTPTTPSATSTATAATVPGEPSRDVSSTSLYLREPGDGPAPVRVSGSTTIIPSASTQAMVAERQPPRVISSWKLCLDESGSVTMVDKLKSTGFVDYDASIRGELASWKYAPYEKDGQIVPVCTMVSLVYSASRATAGQ